MTPAACGSSVKRSEDLESPHSFHRSRKAYNNNMIYIYTHTLEAKQVFEQKQVPPQNSDAIPYLPHCWHRLMSAINDLPSSELFSTSMKSSEIKDTLFIHCCPFLCFMKPRFSTSLVAMSLSICISMVYFLP